MKKSKFTKSLFITLSFAAIANFSLFANELDEKVENNLNETSNELVSESKSVEESSENLAEEVEENLEKSEISKENSDEIENSKESENSNNEENSTENSENITEKQVPTQIKIIKKNQPKEENSKDESTDSYDSDAELSNNSNKKESASAKKSQGATSSKTSKKSKSSKKSFNPFEGFFDTKQADYHFYETIPLSTGTIGYGIKARSAEIFLIPDTTKVGLQTYFQSSWFNILIDQKDISLITDGLSKYLEEFEQKKLIKGKTAKTRRMYTEKGKCRVEWGTVKTMMNNYGDTKFHVGYEFKNNSPYFCIIIKDAKNIAQDIGTNVSQNSVEIQLYFTKAQAKRLAEVWGLERLKQETNFLTEDEIFKTDNYANDNY